MSQEEFGGESSRRNQDSQDADQRPFKKARYVWQLKGKYHLKKHFRSESSRADTSGPSTTEDNNNDSPNYNNNNNNNEQENNNNNVSENNNNEHECNNNIVCQNRCCVTTARPNGTTTSTAAAAEQQEVSSSNAENLVANFEHIPVSLVQKQKENMLYKWQARQVAKSFVDNTINSILEHCKLAPYDASDMIENCENGEKVEDEGILMAIQSHGLQSNSSDDLFPPTRFETVTSSTSTEEPTSTKKLKNENRNGNGNENNSAKHEQTNMEEFALDNLENFQNEMVKQNNSSDITECDSTVIENIPEGSQQSTTTANIEDPMDFLNAAVSVAIQKKGLSSCSYG